MDKRFVDTWVRIEFSWLNVLYLLLGKKCYISTTPEEIDGRIVTKIHVYVEPIFPKKVQATVGGIK